MQTRDGRRIETAGLVLVRQRPGSAKGVMFITLEDETGIVNVVVWPKVFEQFRRAVMAASTEARRSLGRTRHRRRRDTPFPPPRGRGDQVTHAGGGPDPREMPPRRRGPHDGSADRPIDTINVKSRHFH